MESWLGGHPLGAAIRLRLENPALPSTTEHLIRSTCLELTISNQDPTTRIRISNRSLALKQRESLCEVCLASPQRLTAHRDLWFEGIGVLWVRHEWVNALLNGYLSSCSERA